MKILHKTLGNAPINSKQLIFIHDAKEDHALREQVADMILGAPDGNSYAVLYLADGEPFMPDFDSPELSRINLYVPIVTKTFLSECGNDFSFNTLTNRGIAVLPVVENADLIPLYNRKFKNVHAITLTMQNPALEIEKLLSRMLVNAELIEEIISDAFTRKLFLSYRKKDKAEVARIMKAVHKTRWAKAAAIWFDDFLEPGTDFESGISSAMREADAIIFAVTNNLPALNNEGKKNYVCEYEYPDAVRLGKERIAVETEPTPREELDSALGKDFPECIPVDDEERMNSAFDKLGGEEPKADPYVQYLRAMAYLLGVRVEKDPEKAIGMLVDCANNGVAEAALQLSDMYTYGLTVKFSNNENYSIEITPQKACEFKLLAFRNAEKMEKNRRRLELMSRILLSDVGVTVSNDVRQRDKFCNELIDDIRDFAKSNSKKLDDEMLLWQAEAYIDLGNVEDHPVSMISQVNNYHMDEKNWLYQLEILLTYAKNKLDSVKVQNAEYNRICAKRYSIYSSLVREKREKGNYGAYEAHMAVRYQETAAELEPTWSARWRLASYRYNAMGCRFLDERFGVLPPAEAQQCVDEYEKLYREKKDAQLGTELIGTYHSMQLTTKDKNEKRKYLDRAYERCQEVRKDFPNYPPLSKEEKMLIADMPWMKYQLNGKSETEVSHFKKRVFTAFDNAIITLATIASLLNCVVFAFACVNFGLPVFLSVILGVLVIFPTFRIMRMKDGWHVALGILIGLIVLLGYLILLPLLFRNVSPTVKMIICLVDCFLIFLV